MAYSLQIKKEVVEKIQQGMKIGKVAAMYGVSRQAINNWLRSPEKYLSETRKAHTPFDRKRSIRDRLDRWKSDGMGTFYSHFFNRTSRSILFASGHLSFMNSDHGIMSSMPSGSLM